MNYRLRIILGCSAAVLLQSASVLAAAAEAAPKSARAPGATPMLAGHPDFSGNWAGATGSMPAGFDVTREADGSILASSARMLRAVGGPGGAPNQAAAPPPDPAARMAAMMPPFKPELTAKAAQLYKNGEEEDKVSRCGQPGLPRVGGPQKIVQTASEMVILYADGSGMAWRVIPLDGRKHRDRVDPSYYGDSIGRWQGNTLVIETVNFSEDTWMGEFGNFHSDRMRVIETLRRDGMQLTWQATVEDPQVLTKPWVKAPVVMTYTDQQIEEPPVCVPTTYKDPAGHHIQRF
jgi:hypothetical protein